MHSPIKIGALRHRDNVGEGVDPRPRAVLGDHACGVAGFGEDCDRAHGQVFGGVRDRFADGFGDGEAVALTTAARLRKLVQVALGFDDDSRHDGHGFAGIESAGGFGGEHNRIGAVENGVGHIAGFGARGARILDH